MKKILLITAALAGLFAAASCQKEEIGAVAPGTGNVTFTIQTPQDPVTRTIGDGENVDIVYYEIYKAEDDHANSLNGGAPLVDGTVEMSGKVATLSLNLLEDQDYVALFWAQVTPKQQGVQYYNVTDLRNVEVKYDGVNSNDEARAAFYRRLPFNTTNDVNTKVELVRPFAQLNIGHTLNGLDLGYTVDITASKVTVTSPAKFFNVNTASAHTSAGPVTFALAANPDEPLMANNAVYEYAAMNYFLVNGNTGSVDVEFDIETDKGTVSDKFVAQVPVKMNFRTNLLGNLLTQETKIEIVVDERFTQPDEVVLLANDGFTLQQAINAAASGDEIKLQNDIDLNELFNTLVKSSSAPQSVTVNAGKNVVLNLNGYNITGVDETSKNYGLIQNNGTLSIINTAETVSTIRLVATVNSGWNRYSAVISNNPGATLTVGAGVEIEHCGGTDMAYGIDILTNGGIGNVNATIDGATVKSVYRAIRQFLNSDSKENNLTVKAGSVIEGANKSIFFHDPSKKANNGTLVVEDGAQLKGDVYLYVTEGSKDWPVSVSIADNALQGESAVLSANVPALYEVALKNGFWSVEPCMGFDTFVAAVIEGNGTFNGNDITVKVLPLSGRSDRTNGCLIPDRLQKYSNPEVFYAQYQRFAELQDITISNVNFRFVPSAITVQDAWNTAGSTTTLENINGELQLMNAGTATLTNCTFDKMAVSPINASSVVVEGCKFDGLQAYAIKDIKASAATVTDTEFHDCNGGFWFADAPASVTAVGNTFTGVGRRGAVQFSAAGDYTNTTFNISGNKVDGAFLWQLNKTITKAQIDQVLANNTYTTAYVDGSVVPAN